MKKVYVFILLILFFLKIQAQSFEWAKLEGLYAYDYGYGIANDISGNVYLSGKYEMNANFSGTILPQTGNHDIFIAKYNSSGTLIWTRTAGGIYGDYAHALACDGTNYLYVAGEVEGFGTLINFVGSSISLTSKGSNDIFLAKYDLDGNLLWAQQAGGYHDDEALGISCDNNGNVYVCGFFTDTATFSNTTIYGKGNRDVFIAKYDTNGNFQWVRQAGSVGRDEAKAIKCDTQGNIYITGMYKDEMFYGTDTLTSPLGYFNVFLAKYAPDGNLIWVKTAGGDYDDVAWALTLDNTNKIYITGEFNAYAHFGSFPLTTTGQSDIFVTCYDDSGNVLWAKSAGGPLIDRARGIGCDGTNLYITGQFSMSANFDSLSVTGVDSTEIFMAKINNSGMFEWVSSVGGPADSLELLGYESGIGICAESSGNVYVTGTLITGGEFNTTPLAPYSRTDIFITKITQGPDTIAPLSTIYNPLDNSINVASNSNLIITFNEAIQKGTGNIYIKENGFVSQTIDVNGTNVSISDNIVTVDPSDLLFGASVNIEIPNGVFKDIANNNFSGISDASTWNFTVETITATNNISSEKQFSLYPNPVNGEFTINLNQHKSQIIEITISNSIGQIIEKKTCKYNSPLIINFSDNKKGIYFIEIQSEDLQTFRKKIIYQ